MKFLLLAGLAVPAVVTGIHQGGLHAHIQETIARRLELTADQKAAAHTIIAAHRTALHAGLAAVVRSRADVLQALADPETTEPRIRELEGLASTAHLAMELEVNRVVKEIAPILTPDQRVKARQLVLDARAHVDAFAQGLMTEAPAS
jgi:Spy/CpxP family protein refolding chaperone